MSKHLNGDLHRYDDVLRLRDGRRLRVRFVLPDDADTIQTYVRGLSTNSRHNRFRSALLELPPRELDRAIHVDEDDRFALLAEMMDGATPVVVGEVRYKLHPDRSVELGISVADAWHGQGIGRALLSNLECRAAALGGNWLFGDTLRSNGEMLALAKALGFVLLHTPDDWSQVRFSKPIVQSPEAIPCEQWRIAAKALRGLPSGAAAGASRNRAFAASRKYRLSSISADFSEAWISPETRSKAERASAALRPTTFR